MKLGRKATGGKFIKQRKRKSYERLGQRRTVKLGEEKRKSVRIMGGNDKTFLLRGQTINVRTTTNTQKTIITNVLETPSNRFLARQNVITKSTIVETELGKVKITNRPTQEGNINGILLE
ncbi:MAG: 30S ribosomal protein S8e [Nanoarchaeota archaeon]|jgi:small subunit ribosomal protein S8e|nr:30S ribosomal protein S8e [Nanoarchaeota archaeon]